MGIKLGPKENELYKRTDEVLHYIWDPIGVSGSPYARDEYYGYLPQIYTMVLNQSSIKKIAKYLVKIESEYMGLKANKSRAKEVAEILLTYRKKIFNEDS